MKILRTDSNLTEEVAPHSGQNRGQPGVAGSGFGVANESFINIVEEMETRRLLDELNVLGSQLSRFPTMTLLVQYRSLVRQLLDRARQNMQNRREFKWRRTERAMFIFIEKTSTSLNLAFLFLWNFLFKRYHHQIWFERIPLKSFIEASVLCVKI